MGDIKKNIGNLNDPRMPYNYAEREYGTVPKDTKRDPFQWVSEVAYKNVHRIVTRGYDTTELMEEGYGLVDVLFINFQSRIPSANEEKMLNYIMVLALEDGLSMPASISRLVGRSKTFLTQAAGASILAFGHAYGAFSAFGNRLEEYSEIEWLYISANYCDEPGEISVEIRVEYEWGEMEDMFYYPVITWDADTFDEWKSGWPDPTFNGIFPDWTSDEMMELLGMEEEDWQKTWD